VAPGFHPAGVVVKLAPFDADTLQHFIYLERPHDCDVEDGAGFEPRQRWTIASSPGLSRSSSRSFMLKKA
jgi:hypothetical protein